MVREPARYFLPDANASYGRAFRCSSISRLFVQPPRCRFRLLRLHAGGVKDISPPVSKRSSHRGLVEIPRGHRTLAGVQGERRSRSRFPFSPVSGQIPDKYLPLNMSPDDSLRRRKEPLCFRVGAQHNDVRVGT